MNLVERKQRLHPEEFVHTAPIPLSNTKEMPVLAGLVAVGVGFLLTFELGRLVSLFYALIIALVALLLFRSGNHVILIQTGRG